MRRALRLVRIGLHLAAGYATCVIIYPLVSGRTRAALRRNWARGVLAILGIGLRRDVLHVAAGTLVVANHVSWLDAVVLRALLDGATVAKVETRRWPLLGLMLERNDTIFVERRASRALLAVNATIAARLAKGAVVIFFPEGTTTDGSEVLPFRPALFQPAVAAGHPVRALALRYRDDAGRHCREAAFIDDMSLWHSLSAIAALPVLHAEVHSCGTLSTTGLHRREVAGLACTAVRERVCGREILGRDETEPEGSAATESWVRDESTGGAGAIGRTTSAY
jgi:1-acyl-sn-glycerol-3-phosphate acyltransferase